MTTTVAPDRKPEPPESDERPTHVRSAADATPQAPEILSFDPTQGRKLGSDPYDDLTQGRKVGSDPYDDLTQGPKVGSDPHGDLTRGRKLGSHPYDDRGRAR